jgi:sugar lactone lactonase YvrE
MWRSISALVMLVGCGDNLKTPSDARADSPAIDAKVFHDASNIDAGPRGPAAFQLPGVGNGVYWDDAAATLYLTDDSHDQLVKWTDLGGFVTYGMFPSSTGTLALGTVIVQSDSTFVTPNFGGGTSGTLFTMAADGQSSAAITGVDVTRRRIGIARDSADLVYESFFTGMGTGTPTGGVGTIAIAAGVGTETTITSTGLKRVTGVLVTATTFYVCDQTQAKIIAFTIPGFTQSNFATVPSCDQMIFLPNGDIATGSVTGGVYRVTPAAVVSTILSGLDQPRGLAYDPTLKRLFVIEHSQVLGGHDMLHVVPLDD